LHNEFDVREGREGIGRNGSRGEESVRNWKEAKLALSYNLILIL
jgi:hypothetical protein